MKGLSSRQITDLNTDHDNGIFFEALIVTRDMNANPQVKDYFAKFGRNISFDGNEYLPLPMSFTGMNVTSNMDIPTNTANILNMGGIINRYVYDNAVRIKRNDIVFQILHQDKFGRFEMYDQEELQILVVRGVPGQGAASIFASLGWKLGDKVPKETLETSEFPGIRADVIRSST